MKIPSGHDIKTSFFPFINIQNTTDDYKRASWIAGRTSKAFYAENINGVDELVSHHALHDCISKRRCYSFHLNVGQCPWIRRSTPLYTQTAMSIKEKMMMWVLILRKTVCRELIKKEEFKNLNIKHHTYYQKWLVLLDIPKNPHESSRDQNAQFVYERTRSIRFFGWRRLDKRILDWYGTCN